MAPKKGTTNNPHGRPVGSKNKITNASKIILQRIFSENEEKLTEDLEKVREKSNFHHAKLLLEIAKIITPRPQNDEEKEIDAIRSKLMEKLGLTKGEE